MITLFILVTFSRDYVLIHLILSLRQAPLGFAICVCRRVMSSGESRGGARPPPLFSDQNEAPRAEKILGGTVPSPTPPYFRVWMTSPPPPPQRSGSAADFRLIESQLKGVK